MTAPIRVLIVDDVAMFRKVLTEILTEDPILQVVDTAPNGKIALQKIRQLNPDVVVLDVEMPEMDGIETLRQLKAQGNSPGVIMFSALTKRGAEKTLEALSNGAFDFVAKPSTNVSASIQTIRSELLPKVKAYAESKGKLPRQLIEPVRKPNLRPAAVPSFYAKQLKQCLAIGISTGGPGVLKTFFEQVPSYWRFPLLIVQHMPPLFTSKLAETLNTLTHYTVKEAEANEEVLPGMAYLAPGGLHMEIRREGTRMFLHLHDAPPENSCRPSVDILFRSLAQFYGHLTLAAVFTGMGIDGTQGAAKLKQEGAIILTQDQESSVVWGMPRSIVEAQLNDEEFNLKDVISKMEKYLDFQAPFQQRKPPLRSGGALPK